MRRWIFLLIAIIFAANIVAIGVGCKGKEAPKPAAKEEVKPAEAPAQPPAAPEAKPEEKPAAEPEKPAEAPKKQKEAIQFPVQERTKAELETALSFFSILLTDIVNCGSSIKVEVKAIDEASEVKLLFSEGSIAAIDRNFLEA